MPPQRDAVAGRIKRFDSAIGEHEPSQEGVVPFSLRQLLGHSREGQDPDRQPASYRLDSRLLGETDPQLDPFRFETQRRPIRLVAAHLLELRHFPVEPAQVVFNTKGRFEVDVVDSLDAGLIHPDSTGKLDGYPSLRSLRVKLRFRENLGCEKQHFRVRLSPRVRRKARLHHTAV